MAGLMGRNEVRNWKLKVVAVAAACGSLLAATASPASADLDKMLAGVTGTVDVKGVGCAGTHPVAFNGLAIVGAFASPNSSSSLASANVPFVGTVGAVGGRVCANITSQF